LLVKYLVMSQVTSAEVPTLFSWEPGFLLFLRLAGFVDYDVLFRIGSDGQSRGASSAIPPSQIALAQPAEDLKPSCTFTVLNS
jgi:hypothetical protein